MATSGEVYFIGVDVGTASVRAGLYSLSFKSFQKVAVQPITVHKAVVSVKDADNTEIISQSSTEIWTSVCAVVQKVTQGVDPATVRGIGFDATCSLVIIGPEDKPMDVDGTIDSLLDGQSTYLDVIMWQDHRAKYPKETDFINKELAGHPSLSFVGGQVSLEMEIPKLLWLKKHRPEVFHTASKFMDLCDFLSWKASGDLSRSMCSVVCKWLYQVDPSGQGSSVSHRWDSELFRKINLVELSLDNFNKIGSVVRVPGSLTNMSVTTVAARELGLPAGTPVSIGLIDAHAGGLALAFCSHSTGQPTDRFKRLALICGTSTCFMQCSPKPVFVPGVWGPYYSAMIPDSWLTEAGQSAAGQFLDLMVRTHPYYLTSLKSQDLTSTYIHLNKRIEEIRQEKSLNDVGYLSQGLHVFPDFHGNRSPLSNPEMKGMIMGQTMDCESELSLLRLYVAAVQGLAYETRWIMDELVRHGIEIADVAICGGLANNPFFIKTLSDVVGRPVLLPEIKESVLLGSAILAASVSEVFESLEDAATQMAGSSRTVESSLSTGMYHDARYAVFRKMALFQQDILRSV